MRVTVVVVGGIKGALADVVTDYETRAGHYWKLDVVEVAAGGRGDAEAVKRAEGERILQRLPDRGQVLLLTRKGKGMTSPEFARRMEEWMVRSEPAVSFVIGGAFGVSPEVAKRATRTFSLSTGTLPHEMARMILAEQLYRAGTILRNEPYHKGGR